MIESYTLRILDSKDQILGTGFLVAKDLAVPCAHVVANIDKTIQVQFAGRDEILSAQVIPEYYRDPDNGDIAFLRLESTPENSTPLHLGAAEHSPSGNLFQAFGYPSVGDVESIHARGESDSHFFQGLSLEQYCVRPAFRSSVINSCSGRPSSEARVERLTCRLSLNSR